MLAYTARTSLSKTAELHARHLHSTPRRKPSPENVADQLLYRRATTKTTFQATTIEVDNVWWPKRNLQELYRNHYEYKKNRAEERQRQHCSLVIKWKRCSYREAVEMRISRTWSVNNQGEKIFFSTIVHNSSSNHRISYFRIANYTIHITIDLFEFVHISIKKF